ncbi:uncharacterized protein LOC118302479 [Scophthalmus maximus]|uniref:uncharacterized protein LOC118302479 n=1 Tax=Scophthalmus maximus TaxID=52904 RepID=UPI001FA828F8|nr:uncharacterized protein LOC118302479 [Scophthalmus maximus]
MSSTDCLRLFVLCLWLLPCDVNCENSLKGYVLKPVHSGHSQLGVHNDNRDYERLGERTIFRIPTAVFKTSSVDRGESGNIYPAQEDQRNPDSRSSQTQSRRHPHHHAVVPGTLNGNVENSKINRGKYSFNVGSLTRGRSTDVYKQSGNKRVAFSGGKTIHEASSDSVFSTGSVQSQLRRHHTRTGTKGGFLPVQVDKAPVSFGHNSREGLLSSHSNTDGQNIQAIKSSRKSESHRSHVNPSGPIVPAEKVRPRVPWSPRALRGDVTSEERGYANVRRLKPGLDKKQPHASSAGGTKFPATGLPSANQNRGSYSHDSTKVGFGHGVLTSSERPQNFINNRRESQPFRLHFPPPNKAHIPAQGKFQPFQRLLANDDPSSDSNATSTQTSAGTGPPPSGLNSTGVTSTVAPSVSGEPSTNSSSPIQTEDRDAEPQGSNLEDSAEAGPSLNQNQLSTAFPPQLPPEETEGEM